MSTAPMSIDLATMKTTQQQAWASGNYARIGSTLQIVGEELAEAVIHSAGDRVLDVAAGNGNVTLACARRFCDVTSTDYVPELLAHGRERADVDGLTVHFQVEDAEALSFDDASFDVVVSTFGVMFTADQHAAASEMQRVCRSGGRIGMANWTPDGFIGRMFRIIGAYANLPVDAPKPPVWGTEAWLTSTFTDASEVSVTPKMFMFSYPSPRAFVEFFRAWYGPLQRLFLALEPEQQMALERDLLALIAEGNEATDGTMRVPAEYLEVVITMA